MLLDLKLFIVLKSHTLKLYIKNKVKNKLYYEYFPVYAVKAFTLAEVLMTLLIIGIVASTVIPALINDTSDAELNNALKKVYAELSIATKQILFDNGGTFVGVLTTNNDHKGLRNTYQVYLNYVKSCNNAINEGCWHPFSANGGTLKILNGNKGDDLSSGSGLILSNGTLVNFISFKKDCSYNGYYSKPKICAWIIVDVNGLKKPNTVGKDVFYFNILADRLEPWGAPDSLDHNCNSTGFFCAASKLMQ